MDYMSCNVLQCPKGGLLSSDHVFNEANEIGVCMGSILLTTPDALPDTMFRQYNALDSASYNGIGGLNI